MCFRNRKSLLEVSATLIAAAITASVHASDAEQVAYRIHRGDSEYDVMGWSVAGLGDVNGDGVRDYVIGVPGYGPSGFFVGRAYVISGATGNRIRDLAAGVSVVDMGGFSVASAGDVDADGRDDIVVSAPFALNARGEVRVFSGRTGLELHTFAGDLANELTGFSVAGAGDVNGDGYDDVIVGTPYGDNLFGTHTGRIRVYSGFDGSSLLDWYTLPVAKFGYSVAGLGDITGDGFPDVGVGAPAVGKVYLLDARNHGQVRVISGSATKQFGKSIANAGDVNGDGVNDLVVGSDDGAYIYDGATGTKLQSFANGLGAAVAGAGDVNGDGYNDVIIGDSWTTIAHDGRVEVRSGIDGTLLAFFDGATSADEFGSSAAGIGDIDGDGYTDLLIGAPRNDNNGEDSGAAYVILGGPNHLDMAVGGNFALFTANPDFAIAADLDGHNGPDLVSLNTSVNHLSVQMNRGDGTFNTTTFLGTGPDPSSVAAVDIDRDGDLDLAVACAGENRVRLFMNSPGHMTLSGTIAAGHRPSSIVTGDFNRDGYADLAVANRNDNTVTIYLNNKASSGPLYERYAARENFAVGADPVKLVVADFNGDGYPDIAAADASSHQFAALINKQTGRFRKPRLTALPDEPACMVVADFDRDGKKDIAWVGKTLNSVLVCRGLGTGFFEASQEFAAGASPSAVTTIDFNYDGFQDLVVSNAGDSTVAVLVNDRHGQFGSPITTNVASPPAWMVASDFDNSLTTDIAIVGGDIGMSSVCFSQWLIYP